MTGGNLVILRLGRSRELHKLGFADIGGFGFRIQDSGFRGLRM